MKNPKESSDISCADINIHELCTVDHAVCDLEVENVVRKHPMEICDLMNINKFSMNLVGFSMVVFFMVVFYDPHFLHIHC